MKFLSNKWFTLFCALFNAGFCILHIMYANWFWLVLNAACAWICFHSFFNQR